MHIYLGAKATIFNINTLTKLGWDSAKAVQRAVAQVCSVRTRKLAPRRKSPTVARKRDELYSYVELKAFIVSIPANFTAHGPTFACDKYKKHRRDNCTSITRVFKIKRYNLFGCFVELYNPIDIIKSDLCKSLFNNMFCTTTLD